MLRGLFSTIILVLLTVHVFGQGDFPEPMGDKKLAKDYFNSGNYKMAMKEYDILVNKKPKNVDYNYHLGISALRSNVDKSKAIKHLEFVAQQDKYDVDVLFQLGLAYHVNYRFDDAIKMFNKYLDESKGKDSLIVDLQINYCLNGKELVKYPVDVTFEKLDDKVNSEYADWGPYVSDEEDFVAFSTKRKGTSGNLMDYDGSYTSDIYYSKTKSSDNWSRARALSNMMSTEMPEEIVGISRNGMHVIYNADDFGMKNLMMSSKPKERSRSFPAPFPLEGINTASNEFAGTVTNDADILIFSSDREGGYGGLDLYMARKLPDGNWGKAINLGPEINSPADENYPNISGNGKVLYFASNGRKSMGGYDIFKTTFDEWTNRFNAPKNIGYPLNTTMDDYNICFTASGRNAYISQFRRGSYGDYDIYRLTFNEVLPQFTVLRGLILTDSTLSIFTDSLTNHTKRLEAHISKMIQDQADSLAIDSLRKELSKTVRQLDLYDPVTLNDIKVIDRETGNVFGKYKPNEKTGRYIIILPPGSYELKIKNEGFEDYSKNLLIQDKSYYKPEIEENIHLVPKAN